MKSNSAAFSSAQVYRGILGAVKTTLIPNIPRKMLFAALGIDNKENSRLLGNIRQGAEACAEGGKIL